MTAAAGVPPAGAARIVRVEDRARFRCARCGETFADASSLVSHKVWHRKHDAPVEEDLHRRDGGVTGARGGPTRGHQSGVRRGNDVAGALTHAQRDLLREGEELMRRLDTVRASSSSSTSSSSMGRLHATSRTSLAQRLRAEKEERARRDGIDGWTSPTPSPTRAPPQQKQPGTRPSAGDVDEEGSEKGRDEVLETAAPPRRPVAPRYGSEVPDEPPARPPRVSSPHEPETIRYRDDDDDDDKDEDEASSSSSSTASFNSSDDAADGTAPSTIVTVVTADDGLFRPACAPIALRKAPGQIRREEAAAARAAARAAALEAGPRERRPRSENGESRPGTVEAPSRPLPRWQGGTVIRRDRAGSGGLGGGGAGTGATRGDGDNAERPEERVDPRWGDPGGRLLDRARAAAVQIATRELARQAKRLAIKEKGIVPGDAGAVGARKGGGRDGATPESGAVNAIFERVDSGDESGDDEARGSGSVGFLARYRALVRERDVGVLREREDREARAREEEEWRSSRSDDEDDDDDEGDEEEGDRDGRARAVAPNEEDESFVEELTPEEEDELAEFERLEREVAAEVGAA